MAEKVAANRRTLPGMTRLSMPVRSFFSSRSFWKFSIFIMMPWSCSTISEISARVAVLDRAGGFRFGNATEERNDGSARVTSAVPEVVVGGRVVLAEPLQDEFVVQQAVERPEEEDVERQVANPLLLEVPAQSFNLPTRPEVKQKKGIFFYITPVR